MIAHQTLAKWVGANVPAVEYVEDAPSSIFLDQLPEAPDRAVCFYASSGVGLEADTKLKYDPFYVQIVVRSDSDPQWAMDTWQQIYEALHGLRNKVMPDGEYLAFAIVTQGSPIRIGPDDTGRHRYSMNVRGEMIRP